MDLFSCLLSDRIEYNHYALWSSVVVTFSYLLSLDSFRSYPRTKCYNHVSPKLFWFVLNCLLPDITNARLLQKKRPILRKKEDVSLVKKVLIFSRPYLFVIIN